MTAFGFYCPHALVNSTCNSVCTMYEGDPSAVLGGRCHLAQSANASWLPLVLPFMRSPNLWVMTMFYVASVQACLCPLMNSYRVFTRGRSS